MFDLHRHSWFQKATGFLASLGLLRSFAFALFDTVWAVYLFSFLQSESYVGFFSAAFTLIIAILFVVMSPMLQRFDETMLWKRSILVLLTCFALFSIAPNIWVVIAISVVWLFAYSIEFQTSTLLIRDSIPDDELGSTEALTYALKNVAWMTGPLLGGFILESIGVRPVFLFMSAFLLLALLHFRTQSWPHVEHDKETSSPLKNFRNYFKDVSRRRAYMMNGGVSMLWGILYTYMPLYVVSKGFPETWIGLLFFATAAPLVAFTYSTGGWVDKGLYKPLFSIGFAAVALTSALAFLGFSVWWIAGCLLLLGASASLIEGTRDAFFFKVTNQREEEKFVGTYMTARGIGSTVGKLLVAAALLALPIEFFFLTLAILMAGFSVYALSIRPAQACQDQDIQHSR